MNQLNNYVNLSTNQIMNKLVRIANVVMTLDEWVFNFKKSASIRIKRAMPKRMCEHCFKEKGGLLPKHVDFLLYTKEENDIEKCTFTEDATDFVALTQIELDKLNGLPVYAYRSYYGYRKEGRYCSRRCAAEAITYYEYQYVSDIPISKSMIDDGNSYDFDSVKYNVDTMKAAEGKR